MSARRLARERHQVVAAEGEVPAALLVGQLIEVWVPQSKPPDWWADKPHEWAWASTCSRYSLVRSWWLGSSTDATELPTDRPTKGDPWSLEHLSYVGQAQHVGRPVDEIVADWLARVGVARAEISELRNEAQALHVRASRAEAKRRVNKPRMLVRGATND